MGVFNLRVTRWGNGLAVRLPAQMARELNITEGSNIRTEVVRPAQWRLSSARPFDAKAFLDRLDLLHERIPMTEPVVESMRRDARY